MPSDERIGQALEVLSAQTQAFKSALAVTADQITAFGNSQGAAKEKKAAQIATELGRDADTGGQTKYVVDLAKALAEPARPMVAIVGGSKVSTKLTVLEALSEKVDQLVVGGGIANTFLKAMGNNVGKSLCEDDLVDTATI